MLFICVGNGPWIPLTKGQWGGKSFLLYINDLYKSIGHESMSIYADYTAIITSNCDLDISRKQAREISTKLYHCCVANELLINIVKTNFVLFHMKNKTGF